MQSSYLHACMHAKITSSLSFDDETAEQLMEREQSSSSTRDRKQSVEPLEETTEAQRATTTGRRCRCCCLLPFLLLSLSVLTAALLAVVVFVLKPRKPTFQVHAVYLDLDPPTSTGTAADGTSTVVPVLFSTANPNKVGIMYRSSQLALLYVDVGAKGAVGTVDVPTFYQPPHSANLGVLMHVVLATLDVGAFVRRGLEQMSASGGAEVRIVGGVRARVHVFSFNLPEFEVVLDCRINIKNEAAALSRELSHIKTQKALVLSNFPHISQKCSFGLSM